MKFQLNVPDVKKVIADFYFPKSKKKKSSKKQEEEVLPETPFQSLLCENIKRYCVFSDSFKQVNKIWINNFEANTDGVSVYPRKTNKRCWWCRRHFTTCPIGIPLKYHHIDRMTEIMKTRFNDFKTKFNFPKDMESFFEVEGITCSYPCSIAYIYDNLCKCARYKNSASLLSLEYAIMTGRTDPIPVAPHWKELEEYGGHLSEDKFLASIGNLTFTETTNMRTPLVFCSNQYIAELKAKS